MDDNWLHIAYTVVEPPFLNFVYIELDTSNMLMKTQLFLLLCALCKQSEAGFQATMEALEHYKVLA